MEGLRLAFKRGSSWVLRDSGHVPDRDERVLVVDSLLAELDHHVRELNRIFAEREREERRLQTGVDYSWLIASSPKTYQIPQLERLELEELCLKLEVGECTKVISLFRDNVLREPHVEDLIRIMRACVIQTLEQRTSHHKSHSFSKWVTQRAISLANIRKSATRVEPSQELSEDIEMQSDSDSCSRTRSARALSMPNFSVSNVSSGGGDAVVTVEKETSSTSPIFYS